MKKIILVSVLLCSAFAQADTIKCVLSIGYKDAGTASSDFKVNDDGTFYGAIQAKTNDLTAQGYSCDAYAYKDSPGSLVGGPNRPTLGIAVRPAGKDGVIEETLSEGSQIVTVASDKSLQGGFAVSAMTKDVGPVTCSCSLNTEPLAR